LELSTRSRNTSIFFSHCVSNLKAHAHVGLIPMVSQMSLRGILLHWLPLSGELRVGPRYSPVPMFPSFSCNHPRAVLAFSYHHPLSGRLCAVISPKLFAPSYISFILHTVVAYSPSPFYMCVITPRSDAFGRPYENTLRAHE
jgi:hypothetical protein